MEQGTSQVQCISFTIYRFQSRAADASDPDTHVGVVGISEITAYRNGK